MLAYLTHADHATLPAAMALVESMLAQEELDIDIFVACSDDASYEAVAAVRIPHVRPRRGTGDLGRDACRLMAEVHGHRALVALSPRCFLFAAIGDVVLAHLSEHHTVGDVAAFACRWGADTGKIPSGEPLAGVRLAESLSTVRGVLPPCVRFENLRMVALDLVVVDTDEHVRFTSDALVCCVVPYVNALGRATTWARSATVDLGIGMSPKALGPTHTFLVAESTREAVEASRLTHPAVRIDDVWTCYVTEQMYAIAEKLGEPAAQPPPVPYAILAGDEHACARPRVSALVSTYNAEGFIGGCLEDLVAQTLFSRGELEVIVIDSASPTDEQHIVQKFMDRHPGRIRYLRTERREGVYMAWNRAARAARGEFLTNANTDDRHRVDALETLAEALDRNPEIGLVYGRSLVTREAGASFAAADIVGRFVWPPFEREQLLHGCFIGPHPMWRKRVHQTVGWFDQRFRVAGDFEFWLRIAERFGVQLVAEDLGLYCLREESVENANRDWCVRESSAVTLNYRTRAAVAFTPERCRRNFLEQIAPDEGQLAKVG